MLNIERTKKIQLFYFYFILSIKCIAIAILNLTLFYVVWQLRQIYILFYAMLSFGYIFVLSGLAYTHRICNLIYTSFIVYQLRIMYKCMQLPGHCKPNMEKKKQYFLPNNAKRVRNVAYHYHIYLRTSWQVSYIMP